MVNHKRVVVESLIKAHKKKFLSLEECIALQYVAIHVSDKKVKTMCGKIVYRNNAKSYAITLYNRSIMYHYLNKCSFNGIKPESSEEAMILVIEHEVAHIINHFKGGKGHDRMFKTIVKECFNHSESCVKGERHESNRVKEAHNK